MLLYLFLFAHVFWDIWHSLDFSKNDWYKTFPKISYLDEECSNFKLYAPFDNYSNAVVPNSVQ